VTSVGLKRMALARSLAGGAIASVLFTGCVYYNGVYNAKEAARAGDALLRQESETDAAGQFQLSAARAESVLVRFPKSSWRARALYLAGRGAAYGMQCERAIPHLTTFLALPGTEPDDRDRARVALASCEFRTQKIIAARARLDSLVESPNPAVARDARLWAARVALTIGDRDGVAQYLRDMDATALQWELISSSLAAGEFARSESLLVAQATRGNYRDDAVRIVRELWSAGRVVEVEAILRSYDGSRVRDDRRAALHYAVGELNARARRDSTARRHLTLATSLAGRDTVLARDAIVRLSLLSIGQLSSTRQVDSVLARFDVSARATPNVRRVREQLLLVTLLEQRADPTGASLYLAAEVARDSLRAPGIAQSLFLRVAREVNGSTLAPNAYYAAALLQPDSSITWYQRIRSEYPTSGVAMYLRGSDPGVAADFVSTPELLKFSWAETTRIWADSVRKLRAPQRATTSQVQRP